MRTLPLALTLLTLGRAASQWVPCGCSWSSHGGCGISGEQLMHVLSESKVDEMCRRTNNLGDEKLTAKDLQGPQRERAAQITRIECTLRGRIHEYLGGLENCLGMKASECWNARHCQWGAQQEGRCGLDEEQLILGLVGEDNREHPLVQLVRENDYCSSFGEQKCEVDGRCKWNGYNCGMQEVKFYTSLFQHPQLLHLLDILEGSAACHAHYERENECYTPYCRLEYGMCRVNHTRDKGAEQLYDAATRICRQLPPSACQDPCVNHTSHGESFCRVREDLPETFYKADMDRRDWHILGLMLQLNSATYLNERYCNYLDGNETLCDRSEKICDPLKTGGSKTPHASDQPGEEGKGAGTDLAVGMDGLLGKFVSAATIGRVNESLDSYLEQHPNAIGDMFAGLSSGLQKLSEKPIGDRQKEPEELEPPVSPYAYAPLFLVVLGLLCAALSVGVATGTICSSFVGRPHEARLLAPEETMTEYEVATLGATRGQR